MLSLHALGKRFGATPVFHDVSLQLQRGEFIALLGESGVGKSTLLNCIAGLDRADTGQVQINGMDLATLDDDGCARLRRAQLGFVFQAFHVLPHLTVAENVSLPLRLLGRHDPARVLDVLRAEVRDAGAACLLVTHSAAAAARADRVLRLTATGILAAPAP